jgi:hypothetical protein
MQRTSVAVIQRHRGESTSIGGKQSETLPTNPTPWSNYQTVRPLYFPEPLPDPGTGDDHGPLPVRVCDDRVPAPPKPAGERGNGDRPDEEADPEPDPEVGVLPLPRSPGTPVPSGRGGDGAGYEHEPGVLEDTPVAWNGV